MQRLSARADTGIFQWGGGGKHLRRKAAALGSKHTVRRPVAAKIRGPTLVSAKIIRGACLGHCTPLNPPLVWDIHLAQKVPLWFLKPAPRGGALPYVGGYQVPVNRPLFLHCPYTQWPPFFIQSTPSDPLFSTFVSNFT